MFSSAVWNLAAVHRPYTHDSHGAHDKASFARVGSPTKNFHEGDNTMLIDEVDSRVGSATTSSSDIKDTATSAHQRHLTASCEAVSSPGSEGCP